MMKKAFQSRFKVVDTQPNHNKYNIIRYTLYMYMQLSLYSVGLESVGLKSVGLESVGLESVGLESVGLESVGLESVGLESVGLEIQARGSIPSRRPWSCIFRNQSRLGLKMYIFVTLEFTLQ